MSEVNEVYLVLSLRGEYVFVFEDRDHADEYAGCLGDAKVVATDVIPRRVSAGWLHELRELA